MPLSRLWSLSSSLSFSSSPSSSSRSLEDVSISRSVPVPSKPLFLDTAIKGVEFLKFGRFGRPHMRLVRYHLDSHTLSFGSRKLALCDVRAIESTSKVLRRQQSKQPELCFSIITDSRSLDLQAASKEQKEEWEEGLKLLLAGPVSTSVGASPINKPQVDAFRLRIQPTLSAWQSRSQLASGLISSDRALERFLTARNFDFAVTEVMIENALQWREREGVDTILDNPKPLFGQIRTACKYQLEHKYTKSGQPLHIEMIGKLEVDLLLGKFELSDLVRQRVHLMEFKQRIMLYGADLSTNIVDVKGLSPTMIKPKVYKFINSLATISQDYYPESLGQIFVVRAPAIFAIVWKVIKPWLNERTQSKIDIHRDLGLEQVLLKISSSNLPSFLGGACKCPGGCEADSWMENMYLDVCEHGWSGMVKKWKDLLTSGQLVDPDPQLRELFRTIHFK